MKKGMELDKNLARRISEEAMATIKNTIDNYSQLSSFQTLQVIRAYNKSEHEWLAEIIRAIIDSAPFNQYATITRSPNFENDLMGKFTQGPIDMSLDFTLQGRDQNMTDTLAACFYGGEVKTEKADGGEEVVAINKTVFTDAQVSSAADKLAQYFVDKFNKKYGD